MQGNDCRGEQSGGLSDIFRHANFSYPVNDQRRKSDRQDQRSNHIFGQPSDNAISPIGEHSEIMHRSDRQTDDPAARENRYKTIA